METKNIEMLDALKKLIAIGSVQKPAEKDMPFGKDVFDALIYTLSLAESFGFETHNYDNYIGEIVFGSGTPIAVLCHLDVVPIGDEKKWKYNPFQATEENGYLYGRGVLDDKGPLIATLYALKKLKEEGFSPKKQIKFIIGCNEESGWGCIEHYKQVAELPETGFSPDACFPVLYAEKGILHFEANFDFDKSKLFEICGGIAANVVCDEVRFKAIENSLLLPKYNFLKDGDYFVSQGKTAHASEPQLGNNAIYPTICYLEEIGAVDGDIRRFLFDDELKLKDLCDETGHLTMSPDIISIKNGKLSLTVDIRYPSTFNLSQVESELKKVLSYKQLTHQKPLFNDKNSELIQTLLSVYNKHFDKNSQPKAIGGGTYARALKLGAGFGPEDENEPSTAHEPNERINLNKLFDLINIYYDAMKSLTENA